MTPIELPTKKVTTNYQPFTTSVVYGVTAELYCLSKEIKEGINRYSDLFIL